MLVFRAADMKKHFLLGLPIPASFLSTTAVVLSTSGLILSTSGTAFAQGPEDESAEPEGTAPESAGSDAETTNDEVNDEHAPKMHLAVAAPDKPVQRTDYVHEGFYFRFGAGPGFMKTTASPKGSGASASDTGFSLGSELLLGGSPAAGMSFGGGALADLAFQGDSAVHLLAGPFFDAFPNNKGGWHLGALVGFGMLAGSGDSLVGGGGAAWFGHDFWVAPEWSTGLKLRLAGSRVLNSDVGATNFSMHLLVTVLNH